MFITLILYLYIWIYTLYYILCSWVWADYKLWDVESVSCRMHLPKAGLKLSCNARKTKPIMISIVFHDTFNYAAVLEAYARPPNNNSIQVSQ